LISSHPNSPDDTPNRYHGVDNINLPFVEGLLTIGTQVNPKDRNGDTPLHIAAGEGNQAMCEVLVSSGAQIDVLNADGKSASQVARANGHESVALYLLTD